MEFNKKAGQIKSQFNLRLSPKSFTVNFGCKFIRSKCLWILPQKAVQKLGELKSLNWSNRSQGFVTNLGYN